MPGDNCSVTGCGTSRRTKQIGIFKVPGKKKTEWRKRFLDTIKKSRVTDKSFAKQIEEDTVHACARHFHASEIQTRKFFSFYQSALIVFLNGNTDRHFDAKPRVIIYMNMNMSKQDRKVSDARKET